MTDSLLSVGIDLGTTTTQIIFSRLTVENTASASSVPKIQIIEKEIVYRGDIHFTPLLSRTIIDTEAVRRLVEEEYRRAGFTSADISGGAAIITGETARKENSQAVLRTLSGLAGDFVVATAGSDLESILAGRGAGTAAMSRKFYGRPLANLDIGGGTTNTAVFIDGDPVDSSCLDIGGRQIILEPGGLKLEYVAPKIAALAKIMGITLKEGGRTSLDDLVRLTDRLARILAWSLGLNSDDVDLEELNLFITAHPLKRVWSLAGLTFSGGVADFVYPEEDPIDPFIFNDLGPLLGRAIRRCSLFKKVELLQPSETIRATVVGAGSNALELSGSTITVSHPQVLPIKNIPILKLSLADESDNFRYFSSRLAEKISWFRDEETGGYQVLAVAFHGIDNPTFDQVIYLRDQLIEGLSDYLRLNDQVVVVVDCDLAKSLGQTLMNALPDHKIISLDTVKVENGDYIDIGLPVGGGRVVPVVVKTLIFGK